MLCMSLLFKNMFRILVFIYLIQFCVSKEQTVDSKVAEQLYMKLFKKQRAEQLEAIKSFKRINKYDKQYSLINIMVENIFTVIQDSRAIIEASSFIPGVSEFPLDTGIKEALSNILENTALLSEVILRFPDITNRLLKNNNNWELAFQWGITFSHQMRYLLDKNTIKLLDLVNQELNYTERDPNFSNPYREVKKKEVLIDAEEEHIKEKKRKIKKQPRLSIHPEL